MTNKSLKERFEFLRKCSENYENFGTSEFSDEEWDKEYKELLGIDPENPFFNEVGGRIEGVYGETIPHKIPMGSLNKSLSVGEFETWLRNTFDSNDKIRFLLQHKIDGLSVSLLYKQGKLVQALTRGDGEKGINVYGNCQYIEDIPQNIPYKDEVEIRGEIYKDKADFQKTWKSQGYANERNFAAGSLNQKSFEETGRRGLSFLAYEIVRKDDFDYQQDKMDFLKKNGFKNIESSSRLTSETNDFSKIAKEVEVYMNSVDRKNLPYLIDGTVAKLSDISKAKKMGVSNSRKPKSDRAIKYPPTIAETTLLDIEVNTGKSGKLCPVGLLQPVEIDGTTVSRVTLYNFGTLNCKDGLKIGAKVRIAKKGDIIPQIVEVVKNGTKTFDIPKICPSCGANVEWTETGVDLVCHNSNCPSQLVNKIDYFLKTIGVLGIGSSTISKLVELKRVTCISDMYELSAHKEELSITFGKTAFKNIVESLAVVNELPLCKIIEAAGISKIGSMSKDITAIAPTVKDIDNLTEEAIISIKGFSHIKARSFLDGWSEQRNEIAKLLKYITIKEKEMKKDKDKLNGASICVTGTLSRSRNDFVDLIEQNGGKFVTSVTSKTNYLLAGEDCGSKLDKAEKLGVKILEESEFMAMIA